MPNLADPIHEITVQWGTLTCVLYFTSFSLNQELELKHGSFTLHFIKEPKQSKFKCMHGKGEMVCHLD